MGPTIEFVKSQESLYDWNEPNRTLWTGPRPRVVDETLRDGLQNASAKDPSLEEKLAALHAMAAVGVDLVSLGLPAAGPRAVRDTMALLREIVRARLPLTPTAAARTTEGDVTAITDICQQVGASIDVYAFVGCSPIRCYVENWSMQWLLERIRTAGETARREGVLYCLVMEDTTRTPPNVLRDVFAASVDCGAKRICLCDTVGHADPIGTVELVKFAKKTLEDLGASDVELDWHGHNDRGLALANALEAARAGVRGVHGTAGGIGERCGNTSMEHLIDQLVVMGARDALPRHAFDAYRSIRVEAVLDTKPLTTSGTTRAEPVEPLVTLRAKVNGESVELAARPSRTLLELLRYDLDLVGSKQGCDEGDCGACTVLLDGEPVLSCLTLALSCEGRRILTVESLNGAPNLDPLLDAFDRTGAGQCGFCTSGMLMSAKGLLSREPRPSRQRIREAISGNLCRCTGYGAIVDAIEIASNPAAHAPAPPLPGQEWLPKPLPPYAEKKK